MAWHARLKLDYRAEPASAGGTGTRLDFRHEGPLRVLKSLFPEGPEVCHSVIVHPPGAEMLGWDCTALGLPAADAPFVAGDYRHDIAVGPRWLERGRTAASDRVLLDGPCGWAGHRTLGTLWFAAGTALSDARRDTLLDAAREIAGGHALAATAGATAPQPDVVVLRALAPRVEPIHDLLTSVWRTWRALAWAREACVPRVWRT